MKILIAAYVFLGVFAANFLRGLHRQTTSDWLILAALHVAGFTLAAIPIWLRVRKERALRGDAWIWPSLTFGMYALGFALGWFYNL